VKATRVGVVSDTHCPEFLERLPSAIAELLAGVDLILHAGDIGSSGTLAELARLAPVEAIRGDHDRGLDLPDRRVVEVAGKRIGLLHGNRSHLFEEPATFAGTVSLGSGFGADIVEVAPNGSVWHSQIQPGGVFAAGARPQPGATRGA